MIGHDNTRGCDGDLLGAVGVRGICCVGNTLGETSTETLDRGLLSCSGIGSTSSSIFCSSGLGEGLAVPSLRSHGIAELLLLLAFVALSFNNRSSHNPADISSMSCSNCEHLFSSSRICRDITLRYCSYSRDVRVTTGDLSEFDGTAGGVLAFLFRVATGEFGLSSSPLNCPSSFPSSDSASLSWER